MESALTWLQYDVTILFLKNIPNINRKVLENAYDLAVKMVKQIPDDKLLNIVASWQQLTNQNTEDIIFNALSAEVVKIMLRLDSDDAVVNFFALLLIARQLGVNIDDILWRLHREWRKIRNNIKV